MTMQIVITNAGRAAIVNASNSGTLPITVASVGISGTAVTPVATATSLPGEIKRITDVSGALAAADTMHFIVRDTTGDVYNVKSYALYLADGTLFAIYGQTTDIIDKVAASTMLMAVDVKFSSIDATSITFGDTNFLDPPATTDAKGVVELATVAESQAGVDTVRAVTPAAARASILNWLGFTPVQQGGGAGQLSNHIQIGWSLANRLKAQVDLTDLGNFVFDVHIADCWKSTNDGAGSGLDADLLDGQQGSYYADAVGRLGFTPVQQNGGAGQLNNKIYIGWSGTRVKLQVDSSDQGNLVFDAQIADCWKSTNDGSGSGLDADLLDGWQRDEVRDWNNLLNKPYDYGENARGSWERRANGVIEQWGVLPIGSGSTGVITHLDFPIPFPTGVQVITGNADAAASPSWTPITVTFVDRDGSGCSCVADTANVGQTISPGVHVMWRAIGN